jgi:hypothetical protein
VGDSFDVLTLQLLRKEKKESLLWWNQWIHHDWLHRNSSTPESFSSSNCLNISIKIHFKISITVHSATRLSRGLLAVNLFNPNLVKIPHFHPVVYTFHMSHPFHVSKLISYEEQNLYAFSLDLERQCVYFTLSNKNIWVIHCTPHESDLLSAPVLRSELRHVRQNTGYPESSFMVFFSPLI